MLYLRTKFAILIVFVVVVILSMMPLRVRAQDSPSETLSNGDSAITFDYPADWIVHEGDMPDGFTIPSHAAVVQHEP
jgi:hypothetical protein